MSFVLHEIESSGVAPGRVHFEITETTAVTVSHNAREVIQALKDRGCRFLLDDFGSGWSSFAYLLDEAMVRTINEIGHVLGIATIAEFVESEAVLERITALGVDYAQGYAIGRPAPIDAHLGVSRAANIQRNA